jgi:MoaA/NifB/PqqE/SkfB family radical SAM enzyme
MIKTTAINKLSPEPMMVTWDTGKRCNYDCSYCEASRHDLISPHHSLDSYLKTFDFIKQWTAIYDSHKNKISATNINFTGGEPTLNPLFWDLVDIIKNDSRQFNLSLTTNGVWNSKYNDKIISRFAGVTVSYHAEGHPNLKKQVIDNILSLNNSNVRLQVNLMMHVDFWDECVEVYNLLMENNIIVKIRPIGDGNVERQGWFIDSDGSTRRTSHAYSLEQQEWYFKQLGINNNTSSTKLGTDLGRSCCGGRCLVGKVNNVWQEITVVDTKFKDWNCMVDWYFLHVDQQTGLVYHHQTCKALHNKKRGALGNLENPEVMLQELVERMKQPTNIVCPNQRCGCGMCIPKAKDNADFSQLWNSVVADRS